MNVIFTAKLAFTNEIGSPISFRELSKLFIDEESARKSTDNLIDQSENAF